MTAGAGRTLWTTAEAAAATGGRCDRPFAASGVSIDSRSLVSGDLFVALRGPRFDGHDFVAEALGQGAAAAVVHRLPAGIAAAAPLLMVEDTLTALAGLGRVARARTGARIIAVTGSVGKTGTKEALRLVLSRQAPTAANEGSFNNQWGLPLSLARMASDTAFGVFELGMNHPGEIAPLSRLARPHVAVVTTVESVHSAFFGNVAEIADAKAEVFAGMEKRGVAVLNRDNRHYRRLAAAARARGLEVISFGVHRDAQARLIEAALDPIGSRVVADVAGKRLAYRVGTAGRHWVINSLAVLAAVTAAGGDPIAAARALADMRAPKGRGQRQVVHLPAGPFELIDESYNASPVSMCAAIAVLGRAQPGAGGRRLAVLGDMLELGAGAEELHAALLDPLAEHGVDLVFTAGRQMAHLWSALPSAMRGGHAGVVEQLAPLVQAVVRPGDVVMVKGSAGSRMGVVVRALADLDGAAGRSSRRRAVNGE